MSSRYQKILIGVLLASGLSLLWASWWQMEILNISMTVPAQYYGNFNFMGFGNFGLDWWSWRDIFYAWQAAGTLMIALSGYMVGKRKQRKKNHIGR